MNAIFAERSYEVEGEGTLRVSFAEPSQEQGEWIWVCLCQMDWPDGTLSEHKGLGADKLDSLLRAIALARLNIETRDLFLNGKVSWSSSDELGLHVPVPQSHVEWVQEQLASRRS
jgi:hypothetical protein